MSSPDAVASRTWLANAERLRRLSRALIRDAAAAEDVAQETLIALWRKPPPEGTPIGAWVRGLMHNFVRQYGRRTERWRRAFEDGEQFAAQPAESPDRLLEEVQVQRR